MIVEVRVCSACYSPDVDQQQIVWENINTGEENRGDDGFPRRGGALSCNNCAGSMRGIETLYIPQIV